MSTPVNELELIDRLEREREERERERDEVVIYRNDVRWIRATLNEATNYLRIITTIMVIGLMLIFYLGYKLGF
ncbi:hypothetical protein OAP52_04160 [Hellea sp.]|nr:hypothetical protein [Hellea sp.]MDC1061148.1 hypothetical protein [Hellea sp.]